MHICYARPTALLDRETGLPLVVAFYNSSYTAEATAARMEYYRDVDLGVPVSPALFELPEFCVVAPEDEVSSSGGDGMVDVVDASQTVCTRAAPQYNLTDQPTNQPTD
jgi:hypothetical protein